MTSGLIISKDNNQVNMSNKFEIKTVRPPRKLVMAVYGSMRGLSLQDIKASLGRNIITPAQLSELTGVAQTKISTMSVEKDNPKAHKNRITLKRVYPFQTSDNVGPIFILRDESCDEFILQSNK